MRLKRIATISKHIVIAILYGNAHCIRCISYSIRSFSGYVLIRNVYSDLVFEIAKKHLSKNGIHYMRKYAFYNLIVMFTISDIVSQTGVSYSARHGEDPRIHHPTKGMDGDCATCFLGGYHTATWWRVTFGRE